MAIYIPNILPPSLRSLLDGFFSPRTRKFPSSRFIFFLFFVISPSFISAPSKTTFPGANNKTFWCFETEYCFFCLLFSFFRPQIRFFHNNDTAFMHFVSNLWKNHFVEMEKLMLGNPGALEKFKGIHFTSIFRQFNRRHWCSRPMGGPSVQSHR